MTYFHENPAGIAEMLRGPDMLHELLRRAERGRQYALAIAPVRTGRYAAHFKVTSGIDGTGRAYGRLYNDVRALDSSGAPDPHGYPYSIALEWGTRHMRAQRILGRCMDVMARG